MNTASINELKQELITRPPKEVLELCLRLARFKKENKELLSYLLFESGDQQNYIESIKSLITEEFLGVNKSNLYQSKKSIRKILRSTNKFIKYTGSITVEVELLLHFCISIKDSGIRIQKSVALVNLYTNQLKKLMKAIALLHEDLQYDYQKQLEKLEIQSETTFKTLLKIFK